eukprot:5576788-Lingulodinium_polyedra.AAC.1
MAQPFEGFLLVDERNGRRPGKEPGGRAPGVPKLRAEGLDGRCAGAKHVAPERLGDVPGLRGGVLRVE